MEAVEASPDSDQPTPTPLHNRPSRPQPCAQPCARTPSLHLSIPSHRTAPPLNDTLHARAPARTSASHNYLPPPPPPPPLHLSHNHPPNTPRPAPRARAPHLNNVPHDRPALPPAPQRPLRDPRVRQRVRAVRPLHLHAALHPPGFLRLRLLPGDVRRRRVSAARETAAREGRRREGQGGAEL